MIQLTASEPNIKVRSALKAKVFERRCSPLLKRKLTKRSRTGITLPVSGLVYASNPTLPISGPGHQPISSCGLHHHGGTGAQQHPDILSCQQAQQSIHQQQQHQLGQHGLLSLHHQLLQQQHHQLVDLSPPSSPTSISIQMRLLEQQGNSSPTPSSHPYNNFGHVHNPPRADPKRVHHPLLHLHQLQSSLPSSTETYSGQDSAPSLMMVTNQSENPHHQQESISSHHRSHQPPPSQQVVRCKPLVRTLSSPLPLGQAVLGPTGQVTSGYSSPSDGVVNLSINNNSISNLASSSNTQQLNQRKYLLQHIRQTVLTRASSKQQLQRQSFEEETEAAIEQEMKDVDVSEINSATPSTSSSLFTCSTHSTAHMTPKAKFKRQFQQDNVPSIPGKTFPNLTKQSSLEHDRENEYRHLQASLWAHEHLGQLQKPISGLVYASNPSLPVTGHVGIGSYGLPSSYYHQLLQQHQMSEPSPPSSPTSVSMQMRLLEQGHSSPPSSAGHPQHLIHHPQPQHAHHHPLLHFHQLQSSLPNYTYTDQDSSSAMVTNELEDVQRGQESNVSSQDPSQPLVTTTTNSRSAKPLIRTLSSPLPLGRGLSASTSNITSNYGQTGSSSSPFEGALNLCMNNNNNYHNGKSAAVSNLLVSKKSSESSAFNSSSTQQYLQQQQDRKYLLQHIRQTVITRVSTRENQKQLLEKNDQDNVNTTESGQKDQPEKMEEEEELKEENVDVSNSSTPSTSSPLFSCSSQSMAQQQQQSIHLTPKAKFLRQFLQDNIATLPSQVGSGGGVGYSSSPLQSSSTSCVPVSDQHHLQTAGSHDHRT